MAIHTVTVGLPGRAYEIQIGPGEAILLYTDGLPDAVNTASEEFSIERVKEVMREHHPRTATQILDAVSSAVMAHVGVAEAFDDMTMVVIKRRMMDAE